jgi:hypothetical protein
MSKSVLIIFVFIFCYSFGAKAQTFPSDLWHAGRVVLMEGDSITGKVKYDLDNNAVQVTNGRGIETFSALQVKFFEIYDEIFGDFRYFYSLPFLTADGYERPIFFEVLYEGNLTLLAREYIITDNTMQNSWFNRGPFWWPYHRLDFKYFFVDARSGQIQEFNRKRNTLLNIMDKHSSNVRDYIKGNKLKMDQRSDLVKITSYYNGLNF